MPAPAVLSPHRHALVVAPCAPQALQDLKRFGIAVSEWPAPNPQPAYGEKLVHAVMAALDETRPDVLVMPAPDEGDAGQRALALSCLEAARRTSHLACAWISPAAADAPAAGPWQWATLHGGDGDAALLALVSGVHAEPAEPHPHEPPAPGTALVSVIVRSMDRPSLAAALDSVVLQTYRPIELVVVNALGQGHRPLPQRCGGLPVVAVAAPDGQPLLRAQAANRGLAAAAGQLLLFLDDDDLLLPDHVSRLAAALRARPEAPAAFADVAQGRLQGGNWQPVHCFDAGFDPVRLLFENYLPIHGVMFRRTLPGAAPRFDEDFDLFEDWDFWLQLAEHGAFVHVPGVSARYLVSDGQQSDVFTGSAAAQAARDRLVEKWRQHGGPQRYAAALQRLQRLYREASQAQAQVQLLRTGEADLKAVVAAREVEISNAARTVGGLEAIVAARDQELEHAAAHAVGLQRVIVERERELANAATYAADLQRVTAERERELAQAAAHAADLQRVVAEREREITDALAHAGELAGILARREEEVANAVAEVGALRDMLAARDGEIAQRALAAARKDEQIAAQQGDLSRLRAELAELNAEGPLRALKRTLQGKVNGHR